MPVPAVEPGHYGQPVALDNTASAPRPSVLVTPEAQRLRTALTAFAEITPSHLQALRRHHPDLSPDVISAIATQARLQRRALPRLGDLALTWILEDGALQQATRLDVARYRAGQLLRRLGACTVADLGCGLGVDSFALAEAGFTVLAVEHDSWRAEAARVNLAGLGDRVEVRAMDADGLNDADWGRLRAAYVDPARRRGDAPRPLDGSRAKPLANPNNWEPSWSWILALAERLPVVAKVAPSFDTRRTPATADIEWIDHAGETVEATVWLGSLGTGRRKATALREGVVDSFESTGHRTRAAPVATEVQEWLIEPTPAVRRAGLVGEFAAARDIPLLDAGGWLTHMHALDTPLARSWRVLHEVPWRAKDLRAWLRPYGAVTWKTIDAAQSADAWDRRIGHSAVRAGVAITIVVTGQGRAFAVESIRRATTDARDLGQPIGGQRVGDGSDGIGSHSTAPTDKG